MRKRIMSIILAVAVFATMCVSLVGCGAEKVSLDDYINITIDGYNGYGTAYYSCDTEKFEEDYSNVKFTKDGEQEYPYIEDAVDCLVNYVFYNGTLDSVKGTLSNGDTVTFNWNISDENQTEIERLFDVKLSFEDITVTVSGLEDAETFDAFDGVSLSYAGTSPNGTATIEADGKLNSYDFTVEPSSELSNGDTVTVSLVETDLDYYIELYGAIPQETSREFTVDSLPSYVTELSQIPEDGMNEMDAQARDAIASRFAQASNAEYFDSSNINLLGCYLLTPKEGFGTRTSNYIDLVYEITVSIHNVDENGNHYDTPFTFYRYYEFNNGMILPDGTFSIDYSDYSIPYDEVNATAYDYTERWSWNQEKSLGFYGYDNIDTLFNKVVTQNIETYNYESSVGVNDAEQE